MSQLPTILPPRVIETDEQIAARIKMSNMRAMGTRLVVGGLIGAVFAAVITGLRGKQLSKIGFGSWVLGGALLADSMANMGMGGGNNPTVLGGLINTLKGIKPTSPIKNPKLAAMDMHHALPLEPPLK